KGQPKIVTKGNKRYYVPIESRTWFKLEIFGQGIMLPVPDIPQSPEEAVQWHTETSHLPLAVILEMESAKYTNVPKSNSAATTAANAPLVAAAAKR
ncbi:MAG TPA: hypothetical protein VM260_04200, partial [Pirellula sp.]|nr:hypothetical protein [Pirellula sp.]